ncbi:hypothetical protein SAMN04487950_1464 [Halogranum rubrum]|uniref:ZIP Zinc transporter n=1 Tax=Halogranum rubrum TaxID=553466 RepID=A0A1I4CZ59_9EURY|nr:hypothetical protein [Halogranum rubrum]SFK85699.1 hypothetical protein SAMN04487950_1464 [Halogranum rubrum]
MEPVLLGLALGLSFVHLYAGSISPTDIVSARRWLSFTGGVSAAYVFVHLLPELHAGQETLADFGPVESFLDHHAYLLALAGFVVFYGLENLAQRSQRSESDEGRDIFWLHIASFTVYNGLIGYLLVHRLSEGFWNVVLFALAMALHFFVTDAGFRRHHRRAYHRLGRWILSVAVVAGWGVAQVLSLAEPTLAVLVAFLSGGIVLNVTKEEIPAERQSAYPAFVGGVFGYTVLLLTV